jgi:ubiquinone/menaquinone biosynthesis C-methylase UbiE
MGRIHDHVGGAIDAKCVDGKGSGHMLTNSNEADRKQSDDWDTASHEDFYKYYEAQSLKPDTLERFRIACETMLRMYGPTPTGRALDVLDVGCGAGTQSRYWTEHGHKYWGIDINEPLIQLARRRAAEHRLPVRFDVGTATALPCADESIDICLLPELLEHVANWQKCIAEAIRILRPGGLIYVNTSSKLCPKQQEFNLPFYSWYPGGLKRYFERRAITDRPEWVNFAKYPAVNWFSIYGLGEHLKQRGLISYDRFDLVDFRTKGRAARFALSVLRVVPPLRFVGHLMTPYTLLVARKPAPAG